MKVVIDKQDCEIVPNILGALQNRSRITTPARVIPCDILDSDKKKDQFLLESFVILLHRF